VDELDPSGSQHGESPAVRRYEPLVPAAVAFMAGILAADYLGGGRILWSSVALAAAAIWLVFYRSGSRERWLILPLMLVLAAAGAARYRATVEAPPDDIARFADVGQRLLTLEGIVVRSPEASAPPRDVFLPSTPYYVRSTWVLACEKARVGASWTESHGRVRVTVRQPMPENETAVPHLGDRVRIVGLLAPFGQPANPGTFDSARYFRRQGIRASFRTDHWEAVEIVQPGAERLRWFVGAVGRWAVRRLESLPSEEGRAVAAAILFGRRDQLDFDAGQTAGASDDAGRGPDVEKAFILTGTAHFLAVSGFNVGMAAAVVLILMRLLGVGPRVTAVLVSVVVLAYTLMTELEPPILRAAILVWILCLGWLCGRKPLRLNSLAASALIILLLRPGDLFTLSFQLSFLVVLGMFLLVGKVDRVVFRRRPDVERWAGPQGRRAPALRRYLRYTVALSLAASLVSLPLIAYQFHLVAWLAPVGTILLSPLVFGLMASGMALLALGWPVLGWLDLVAALPDALARAIVWVVTALARVPGGHFYTGSFSWPWLLLSYGLLAAWVWRERLGLSHRRLALLVLAAAAVFIWTGGHTAPRAARATFLAVGGGNTNLLELPNGRTILYDAGSSLSYTRAGEGTLAPALWALGIDRLDAVFLSHAHFDHFKDILPLVERFSVRRVFVPPTFLRRRLESDDDVIEKLLARGVRTEFFSAGDRLAGTGRVGLRALWPRTSASMTKTINDGSLVLSVTDRRRRLLLPGDVEAAAIDGLLTAAPRFRADAALWPHHGGGAEAVGRLVRRSGARVLVISAGRIFLPPPEPAWLVERGVVRYRTSDSGTVTLMLDPAGIRVETFLGGPAAAPVGAPPIRAVRPEGEDAADEPDAESVEE